jgi:hypothetical protein
MRLLLELAHGSKFNRGFPERSDSVLSVAFDKQNIKEKIISALLVQVKAFSSGLSWV